MKCTVSAVFILVSLFSLVNGLTIRRIDSTTPKIRTAHTATPLETTVSSYHRVGSPSATGPIVVLQHHGTLDGPSGRFRKTEFFASPPVDLSLSPVFLPESIPVHENPVELYQFASSDVMPSFERTQNLAAPPVDLSKAPVLLPEATPITESTQEADVARQALYFVRG